MAGQSNKILQPLKQAESLNGQAMLRMTNQNNARQTRSYNGARAISGEAK